MQDELIKVRIAPNNPVFDLPVIVGIEEGLFAKAGLDVSFSATYADRERDQAHTPFMARVKEQLFDCGGADSYNVCEWASIDRLERGARGGKLAALRAAVAAQAIVSFDDALQVPRDLVDVPVLVQEFTGSHFTTVQMLESACGADHVRIAQRRAAAGALRRAEGGRRARDRGDGAVHQPCAERGRAHHRGVVLPRRRGGSRPTSRPSSAGPITPPRTRPWTASTPTLRATRIISPRRRTARSGRTSC